MSAVARMQGSSENEENKRIGDYTLLHGIGSGSFGDVYLAVDNMDKKVAIKLEYGNVKSSRLIREYEIYCWLLDGPGIPRIHWFGHDQNRTALAMDPLGPSLHKLFQKCSRRFTLKTVLMLADQIVTRLEYFHSKYHVHRDVKPANFVMGTGDEEHMVYIIDFGLAERYCDCTMKHVPNRFRIGVGTPLFSSLRVHDRMTPSRRDDLESLAYMLILFLKGSLPWDGFKGRRANLTWQLIGEKKSSITTQELCQDLPNEFEIFLAYCRTLEYEETPDYHFIRVLFRLLSKKMRYEYDGQYDWITDSPPAGSSPSLTPSTNNGGEMAHKSDNKDLITNVE